MARSLFTASNPSASPTIGPRRAMKDMNDGIELPLDVYSFRKMKLLSCEIASESPEIAPYRLAKLVAPIRISRMRKRLLVR